MFDTLLQPIHLLILSILCLLLFGKRLPDVARYLGKRLTEYKKGLRKLERSIREDAPECRKDWLGPNDEEPGASLARLEPPDKPRPPAQVALTPPKSSED
jgi:sec-independent protein translocase protein TatA